MYTNEIKETVERVVRVEYVAEDGEIFRNEEECKKYEESALFAISKKLRRLIDRPISHYKINEECSDEDEVEIFDIQTEKDLENLRRYLYLKAKINGASEHCIKSCFTSDDSKRKDFVFDGITVGHEVIIFWNYESNWFWVYKDGSINGYAEFFKEKITKLIEQENKSNKE